jgi:hypothetical protein
MVEIDGLLYVPAAELTEELGITRQTLWRWRNEAKIPQGYRFRNSRILFSPTEAEAIRRHALRLEPIDPAERNQLNLFEQRPNTD